MREKMVEKMSYGTHTSERESRARLRFNAAADSPALSEYFRFLSARCSERLQQNGCYSTSKSCPDQFKETTSLLDRFVPLSVGADGAVCGLPDKSEQSCC